MENITASELNEWKAYFSVYPFKDYREDFRSAMVCASIFNSKRTKNSDKVFSPSEFMPKFELTSTDKNQTNTKINTQKNASLFKLLMSGEGDK